MILRYPLSSLPLLALVLLGALPADAQNSDFDPPVAPDLNPDPDVVEVKLVAGETEWEYVPGVKTRVWAYNHSVPGPTIVAKVGDLLRVHFKNELPEATTIHWHGIESPAHMDGAHITQLHVQPGDSFTYEFRLLRDGLYWYHPHVRTFDQVERGLHALLLVRDPAADARLGLDRIEEHLVVFDDILLDDDLQVVPAFASQVPAEKALYALNGREGNHVLVNGRIAGTRSLNVKNGRLHRWRVLNAANTTFCRLDMNADARVPMVMIGTDSGLIDRPIARPPVIPLETPDPNRQPNPVGWGRGPFIPDDPLSSPVDPSTTASVRSPGSSGGPKKGQAPPTLTITDFPDHAYHSVPQDDFQGIFLMPGERLDVLFVPIASDGQVVRVFQHDWFRGRHSVDVAPSGEIVLGDLPADGRAPAKRYLDLHVKGPLPAKLPSIPTRLRDFTPLDPADAVGTLQVHLGHSLPDPNGDLKLFAQAKFLSTPSGQQMVPLPTSLVDSFEAHDVQMGETWIWEIHNLSHGDHPFHTHGFFFEPYEIEFKDTEVAVFNKKMPLPIQFPKDTIRVPARLGARGSSQAIIRAVVRFDDTGREGQAFAEGELPTFDRNGDWTAGGWLFHCHVLEHSGKGMLSFFEVHDPDDAYRLLGKHLGGSLGNPSLTGHGQPLRGTPLQFDLVDALPNTLVTLAVGQDLVLRPLAGGTLVPAIESVVRGRTDMNGRCTFQISGWEYLASDTEFFAQAAFLDSGAPRGVALSNALSCTLP